MDVLCAEYPGYGLYDSDKPSENAILDDATLIIQHAIQNLKYKEEDIILLGRSLGTGVAIQMANIFTKLRGIVLISPFLSIRDVAENMVGSVLAKVVGDIFKSKDFIQSIKTPALFIHGALDELIPASASKWLYDKCNAPKMLHISPTMTHNKLNLKFDIFLPMVKFFVERLGVVELKYLYEAEVEESTSYNPNVDFNTLVDESCITEEGKEKNYEPNQARMRIETDLLMTVDPLKTDFE